MERQGPVICLTAQEAYMGSMGVSRFWLNQVGRNTSAPDQAVPGATMGTVWLSPRTRTAWKAPGT